ncbi:DNA adenine methylase [Paenibacillus polymyxa]|uniref:DNA adenine methylase n=1 Tax=Paenibacillus polymyxa TaxID=1406 RepID=UPI00307EA7DF
MKSPLNYVGGKYKLLPQLVPLFPKKINTFVDMFTGGCNVGINVEAKKIICNDKDIAVIELFNKFKEHSSDDLLMEIDNIIETYNLSKTNREGFLKLRTDYNSGNKQWYMFYSLLVHSFNNQIRFNSKGEYNMPFGKDRSSFNTSLRSKFIAFVDALKNKNIEFKYNDFRDYKAEKLTADDFVYCDPPYLITTASYNEQGGWTEKDEHDLLYTLDYLNLQKVKFALSNVLIHKGKNNNILKEWSKKYKVRELKNTYKNCNYQTKDRGDNSSLEVLITNY